MNVPSLQSVRFVWNHVLIAVSMYSLSKTSSCFGIGIGFVGHGVWVFGPVRVECVDLWDCCW